MARPKNLRKLGAKRMWIRRWLKAGKITQVEARRFTTHLERTGQLHRPASSVKPSTNGSSTSATIVRSAPGSLVTIQYDPSRFRLALTAIRGARKASRSNHGVAQQ